MLPPLSPTQTVSSQRRQEVRQPRLAHPVAQIQGIAARHQQDVGLLDQGNPTFFIDAGQGGQLQHSQGLPAQLAHRAVGFLSTDELPRFLAGADPGVPVHRGRNAEGAGLADRFAQQVDQRVADARVLDARGSEKKPQDASSVDFSRGDSGGLRKSSRRSPERRERLELRKRRFRWGCRARSARHSPALRCRDRPSLSCRPFSP